jgi:GNAT superfamily N-acetyltransferase
VIAATYSGGVLSLAINDEPIQSSGAQSVYQSAIDELTRRYGADDATWQLDLDEFTPPLGIILVARVDTHPAGCVGVRAISSHALHLGEVKRLWVRPDLRRSGVAAALMDEIEQRARTAGYRQLYLETGDAQPEARALYPKLSWIQVDDFPPGAFSHPSAFRFTKVLQAN